MDRQAADSVARQWTLLRSIPPWPRKTTVGKLKGLLGGYGIAASTRTIERDLQSLSERFALTADQTSKPYGWGWAKDAKFEFAPRLSTSQGVALLMAQVHLRGLLPRAFLDQLTPMFEMASRELSSTGWRDWHLRTAVIPTSLSLLPPRQLAGVLEDVHTAMAARKVLRGMYRSKGASEGREVDVRPLGLLVRGQVQYLVCTMFGYSDIRQLALHRLSDTSVLEHGFDEPPDFDFARYVEAARKYESTGRVRLVVRFDAVTGEHLKETPLSRDQTLKVVDENGSLELTADVESDETLRWWLRAFGQGVEVMEPATLREEMRVEFEKALANYA